jgi:hypothetical protein
LKKIGRAENMEGNPDFSFQRVVARVNAAGNMPTLSVDTAFANEYRWQLDELGISRKFYFTKEGRYSWYIDAVAGREGKSSYHVDTFRDIVIEAAKGT